MRCSNFRASLAVFCLHLLIYLMLLAGCAAPVPVEQEFINPFVSKKELFSVALVREGMSFYNRSRFIDAEFNFRQALYLNPEAENLKLNLALTLAKSAQYEEAESLIRAVLEQNPAEFRYIMALAQVLYGANHFAPAKEAFLRAYELALSKGNSAQASASARSLSVLNFKIGEEQAALCHSLEALTHKRDKTEYLKHLRLLMALGQFSAALSLLEERDLELDIKRDPNVIHLKALSHFALGQYEEAIRLENAAQIILPINPGLKREIKLVQGLARKALGGDGGGGDNGMPEVSAEWEAQFTELVAGMRNISSSAKLYWPAPLLEAFEENLNVLDQT